MPWKSIWKAVSATVFFAAAVGTIIATAILFHQYLGTKQGEWLMDWTIPTWSKLFVLLLLLWLPWLAIWRSWRIGRTLNEISDSRGTLSTRMQGLEEQVNRQSAEIAKPPVAGVLGPSELMWDGVIWTWNGEDARGPVCPKHRVQLGYQAAFGLRSAFAENIDDKWLGTTGWFICPTDEETFKVVRLEKVGQLREQATAKIRAQLNLPSKPIKMPTPQELQLLQTVAPSLFGTIFAPPGEKYTTVTTDGRTKEWTRKEIDTLADPQRAKLDKDLLDWWSRGEPGVPKPPVSSS